MTLIEKLGAWNRWQHVRREFNWEWRKDHKAILDRLCKMQYRDWIIAETLYNSEIKLREEKP